jgi:hypothetical protein
MLQLRQLPTLLTDCVLVGHAKRADVVFTPRQWFAMCIHMLNKNAANFFLKLYRDKDGQPKFSKAFKHDLTKWIEWSWRSSTGKAKALVAVGFYPTNPERKSRWAGMDFDAHDGDTRRARDFALKAFAILYQQLQLFVCLTTSAGDPQHTGYHLFVFSRDFHSCEDWTRLLKQVAAQIGAPVEDGICEIFPNEFRGIGKPLRAPGTWNPKTGDCGLILHESLTQSFLPSLPYGRERDGIALSVLCEPRGENSAVHRVGEIFRGEHGEWKEKFGITAPGTRHHKLTKLVGTAFFQAGREVARRNAEFQHGEATPAPNASLQEHLAEFDKAWAGMKRKWLSELSAAEREKYDGLTTQTERDAFRIIRNWSKKGSPNEFKIRAQSLGDRVGISLSGACKLLRRFRSLDILRQTKPCVPNKYCARFCWTADDEPKRRQPTLISASQSSGDPGDTCLRERRRC